MAKNSGSKSGGDWRGVGDARPSSSTKPEKGQGGHDEASKGDWRGIEDSRPTSSTKSQSVPMSGKE